MQVLKMVLVETGFYGDGLSLWYGKENMWIQWNLSLWPPLYSGQLSGVLWSHTLILFLHQIKQTWEKWIPLYFENFLLVQSMLGLEIFLYYQLKFMTVFLCLQNVTLQGTCKSLFKKWFKLINECCKQQYSRDIALSTL